MKRNRKGQAAMEFLMTYGWAILIVVIAIAALAAFGVFNRPIREGCFPESNMITCEMPVISLVETGTGDAMVQMSLRNSDAGAIDITNLIVGDGDCGAGHTYNVSVDGGATATTAVPRGQTFLLTLVCPNSYIANSDFQEEVTVVFTSGGLPNVNAAFTIASRT
jgi:hypothetical protein